jgi:transposase
VAVAALRSPIRTLVTADDHAVVLKVWSKRHRDLARLRCQAACRLHAALCEIIPGGVPRAITASTAAALLEANPPAGPVATARHQLAADLRQLDDKLRQTRNQITAAVRASGTTLTGIFGVGPIIAATILGDAADIGRFPDRDPVRRLQRHRPGRGVLGKAEDLPALPARQPADEPRHPHGRRHPDPPAAQRRPHLLRQEDRRGQDRQASTLTTPISPRNSTRIMF